MKVFLTIGSVTGKWTHDRPQKVHWVKWEKAISAVYLKPALVASNSASELVQGMTKKGGMEFVMVQ
jgi:hypothetical protein